MRPTHRFLLIVFVIVASLGGTRGVAWAQQAAAPTEADTARARALFVEGVTFADQHHWAEAADRFRQARALRDAPAIRYNLAAALAEKGQAAAPAELADSVLADSATSAAVRGQAEALRARVAPRAARLSISLRGTPPAGTTVRIGDRVLTVAELRRNVYVEPGAQRIVAVSGGRELAHRDVTASAGLAADVALTVAPSPEDAAAAGATDDAGGVVGVVTDWRFLTVVGAVLVVAAIVVIVAVATSGPEDPVTGNFNPGGITWQ